MRLHPLPFLAPFLLAACASAPGTSTRIDLATAAQLEKEVAATERAFAKTMADRDHAAFARFIAEDASFRSPKGPLIGKAAIVADWKRFYEGPQAPFSWEPDLVNVQADGRQALSTGPVRDAQGKVGFRFMSVWRREPDGRWLIILDQGVPYSPPQR
jgi:ketosteroid isomerase-like protein